MREFTRYAARLTLALGCSMMGLDHTSGAALDEARLKAIPLIEVIRIAAPPYADGGPQASADLAPDVRTLARLAALEAMLFSVPDGPTTYSGKPAVLPRTAAALDDAGLAREAAAFRSAISGARPTFDFLPPEAGPPPVVVTLTLGQEFGTKASFEAAVLGYVRTHPGVAAWCDAARLTMPDRDRLAALEQMLAEIPSNAVPATLDAWPRPYRFLQLASIFAVQLSNGGVGQYFWNDTGALAPETVEALRAMGLTRQAAAIERGIASFPPPYPLDATARRHALRDGARGSDIARALDELTDAADLDGIEPAMVAYARHEGVLPR